MRVAPITYNDIRNEPGLLANYADECSISALGEPNPEWETYQHMEAAGVMRLFGLFDGEQMVGFATLLVSILPHYSKLAGTVESLYVSKDHRGALGPALLLHEMEKHATRCGCKAILYCAPAGGQLEAVLGKRYARTNTVFCKALSA